MCYLFALRAHFRHISLLVEVFVLCSLMVQVTFPKPVFFCNIVSCPGAFQGIRVIRGKSILVSPKLAVLPGAFLHSRSARSLFHPWRTVALSRA